MKLVLAIFIFLSLSTSQNHQVGFVQTTSAAAVVDGLTAPVSCLPFLLLQQPTTVNQTLLGTNQQVLDVVETQKLKKGHKQKKNGKIRIVFFKIIFNIHF